MTPFQHIFFVCNNDRGAESPKKSCQQSGAAEVFAQLRQQVIAHNLRKHVRVTTSGCLGLCQQGCVVAVFSADARMPQTWYTHVTAQDVQALFASHVLSQTPYVRLQLAPPPKTD